MLIEIGIHLIDCNPGHICSVLIFLLVMAINRSKYKEECNQGSQILKEVQGRAKLWYLKEDNKKVLVRRRAKV